MIDVEATTRFLNRVLGWTQTVDSLIVVLVVTLAVADLARRQARDGQLGRYGSKEPRWLSIAAPASKQ
jgi:hypothetical protein